MDLIHNAQYMSKDEFVSNLKELKIDIKKTENAWQNSGGLMDKFFKSFGIYMATPSEGMFSFSKLKNASNFYLNMPSDSTYSGMLTQLKGIEKLFIQTWRNTTNFGKNIQKVNPVSTDGGSTTNTNALADSVDTVTGSARQVRNLTVNIDAFNKGGINTQNTSLQHMDGSQIEAWFTEMCMRVIRSVETSF